MQEINKLQDKLIKELDLLISHLEKYEEKYWTSFFKKNRALVDQGDIRSIESLKTIRGGMGSFSDFIICKLNGHNIEINEEDFANQELIRLRNSVTKITDQIKRFINKT